MSTTNSCPSKHARITFEEARRLTRGSMSGPLTFEQLAEILDLGIRKQAKYTGSCYVYDIRPAITSTESTDLIPELQKEFPGFDIQCRFVDPECSRLIIQWGDPLDTDS